MQYCAQYDSPVGPLLLCQTGDALTGLYFRPLETPVSDTPLLRETSRQLDAYFTGQLRSFDLPLQPAGTAFQLAVWQALRRIPYGETRSYGEIARAIGSPGAARAVGTANNRNPISIIVPCHRVIGANGTLVGYGGGLEIKKQLLELEQARFHG